MNKSVSGIVIFVVVVVGMIGYRVLFVDSDEVRNFNDTLVDMVTASDSKFNPFTAHLDRYVDGEQIDVAQMTAARDQLEMSITRDRELLQNMKVPDNDLCREFHGGCRKYVENSLAIAEKYKEVIVHISKNHPGEEADIEVVDALLADLIETDEQLFNAVVASQKKMADKFDFELE